MTNPRFVFSVKRIGSTKWHLPIRAHYPSTLLTRGTLATRVSLSTELTEGNQVFELIRGIYKCYSLVLVRHNTLI